MPRTILLHLLKLIKILRLNPFTNFQTVLIFSQLRPVSFVYITSTSNNYINSIKGETRGGGGGDARVSGTFGHLLDGAHVFYFPGRN